MGLDKLYHAAGCCVITVLLGFFLHWWAPLITFTVVSFIKEVVWDWAIKRGTPDLLDVAANATGCVMGALVIAAVTVR